MVRVYNMDQLAVWLIFMPAISGVQELAQEMGSLFLSALKKTSALLQTHDFGLEWVTETAVVSDKLKMQFPSVRGAQLSSYRVSDSGNKEFLTVATRSF